MVNAVLNQEVIVLEKCLRRKMNVHHNAPKNVNLLKYQRNLVGKQRLPLIKKRRKNVSNLKSVKASSKMTNTIAMVKLF